MLRVGGDGGRPEVDVGSGGRDAVEDGAGVAWGGGRGDERDGGTGGERESTEEELRVELPRRRRGCRAAGEASQERGERGRQHGGRRR